MNDWWHGIWNDPMNENPWAVVAYFVVGALFLAMLHAALMVRTKLRRREQETVEPTDPTPIRTDTSSGEPTGQRGEDDTDRADSSATDPRLVPWAGLSGAYTPPELSGEVDGSGRLRRFADNSPISVPQPGRNILAGDPVTARAVVAHAIVSPVREACPHCKGAGHMPSISDLLQESASWITDMDGVIVAFYNRMLELARADAERAVYGQGGSQSEAWRAGEEAVADLAFIFPEDLLTAAADSDSSGAGQRDKLAKALVALATMYDPADGDKMQRLKAAVNSMGNRHAAFVRRDGSIQGATLGEYDLAKRALMDVLGTLDQLTRAHAEAWSVAYDYVAAGMMQVQQESGFTMPRYPRA